MNSPTDFSSTSMYDATSVNVRQHRKVR